MAASIACCRHCGKVFCTTTNFSGRGGLKNVSLSESVERIDYGAFGWCGALTGITANAGHCAAFSAQKTSPQAMARSRYLGA